MMILSIQTKALIAALAVSAIANALLFASSKASEAKAEAASVKLESAVMLNRHWEESAKIMESELSECAQKWDAAVRSAKDAEKIADQFRAETVRQRMDFDRRWKAITSDCSSALNTMQTACQNDIGEY